MEARCLRARRLGAAALTRQPAVRRGCCAPARSIWRRRGARGGPGAHGVRRSETALRAFLLQQHLAGKSAAGSPARWPPARWPMVRGGRCAGDVIGRTVPRPPDGDGATRTRADAFLAKRKPTGNTDRSNADGHDPAVVQIVQPCEGVRDLVIRRSRTGKVGAARGVRRSATCGLRAARADPRRRHAAGGAWAATRSR